jgi:solute:Na+ symporter, SSS family
MKYLQSQLNYKYIVIYSTYFLLVTLIFGAKNLEAQDQINQLQQKSHAVLADIADIPGNEGLAGCFAGLHNDLYILSGGTAFPDEKPWQDGDKYFSNAILVFEKNDEGEFKLIHSSQLPTGIGEGASVSLPCGVLCMGGLTSEGLSANVFLLSWNNGKIVTEEYPPLPVPVKSVAAAVVGSQVYLVGGESADGTTAHFIKLDLTQLSAGWRVLPSFPVPVSGAMVAAQMDGEEVSLHIFGGRAKLPDNTNTTFYSHVYRFRPSVGQWEKMQDIRTPDGAELPLAAGIAASVGASHIVLAGGDPGITFRNVEKIINSIQNGNSYLLKERDSLWQNHPGFNQQILVYNTVTDSWFEAGKWDEIPVAVTCAVSQGNKVTVFGGEIRPGIRTPLFQEFIFSVKPVFGWINYIVLAVYFVGMLLLGFFFMKRENSTEDFFKAGGRIPWWAAGISIFATTLSAITFIAIPAKAYADDWRMLIFNMTIIMVAPVVIRYFLPFFRRFNFDTAYQYLEGRFNRAVRWLASALFVFFMVSRIAIVLFLPSLALNAVTGFSVYWAIVIMGVVTIIYCTSGGIEAVVWGDVIQGFILVLGALTALAFMLAGVEGGLNGFLSITGEYNKFHMLDFRFDISQPVFWVVLIGGLANTLITYTSDQSVVQRYMTTRDEKATGQSIWLNGILSIPVSIVFFLLGTGLYAYYSSNPARMAVVNPNIDSVFPQFIVSQMPSGIAGLLIAAIFAAAMSTLSSNINSVAAVVTSDFYKVISVKASARQNMNVARWSGIIVGFSGISMALVLATWNIASLWDQFNTFLGLLTSGLGAFFIMGIFFPRISGEAALTGVFVGLIILLIVKNNTSVSFLLYGFIGLIVSVLFAFLIALIIPNKKLVTGYTWKNRNKNLKSNFS